MNYLQLLKDKYPEKCPPSVLTKLTKGGFGGFGSTSDGYLSGNSLHGNSAQECAGNPQVAQAFIESYMDATHDV